MSKHTPGPWVHVAVHGGWDGVAEVANRKSIICALGLNNSANARLIAAAPELLAMLERIRDDKTFRTNDNALWPDLLAVIAKAQGAA